MNAAQNPLLDFADLPQFAQIQPGHISPAIDQLIAQAQAVVDRLSDPKLAPTWSSVIEPLDDATEKLSRAWGAVGHMNGVVDTPELRAAYNENLPKVTEFWTALSQNEALFRQYKALKASPAFLQWSPARKKIVENALRDFRLGGAELPEKEKPRFAQNQERQAELMQKFSENVLDATNAFSLVIEDESELAGLPEDSKLAAREAAQKDGKTGWKFSLHLPSYLPIQQYADSRALREKMYRAYVTRASELGESKWDNTALILELLRLRAEEAALLGYKSFAEVSLVPKMASSPEQVEEFLRDLGKKTKPFAQQDMEEVRAFAKEELGMQELQAWDIAYVSEKLRQNRYAYSEQEIKQYFPEPKVLEGLFHVVQTLFSVQIRPDNAPVWHPDVRFFRIESQTGQLLGQFYLDLYARDHKRGGAWMDDARARRRLAGGKVQTPVTYLTCNFSSPVGGKPACFTHEEVMTLFHEFGHGLHHMLTRIEELGVSGLSGVEWDAVELPSQFMENFCWEWDVLCSMTSHVDTGAPLPRALYDKMLAAKNFQSGLHFARQIEFSLFDMKVHSDFDPNSGATVQQLLNDLRREISVVPIAPFNRFQNSFSHIFAGGYAAGYYSYKWAEVLSADAYAYFEETALQGNVLNPRTGQSFVDEILSVGGSRPALESFIAFRGRPPEIDALLRHNGMATA